MTESERIEILMMIGYGDRKRTHQEVCNLFNDTHPDKNPISKSTVTRTLQRYRETGGVKDRIKTGRPRTATSEDNALSILLDVIEQPKASLRQIAAAHNISRRSVETVLKRDSYHPYKVHLVQQLSGDDFEKRLQFCEQMMEAIANNEDFANHIVFSDEATFYLNGCVNRHNSRYWSDSNPHWMDAVHTQYPQKVNVWCGIVGGHIIGPFFLERTLTSVAYLQLLRERIIPRLIELFPNPNNPNHLAEHIWFQQDGAPPHFAATVRNYLNQTFPGRWIGRRGSIEWPPRSPDLTPLDFFLWGHLKSRVYVNRPESVDVLCHQIQAEVDAIPENWLYNTIQEFKNRFHYCQEVDGHQFEHLLH